MNRFLEINWNYSQFLKKKYISLWIISAQIKKQRLPLNVLCPSLISIYSNGLYIQITIIKINLMAKLKNIPHKHCQSNIRNCFSFFRKADLKFPLQKKKPLHEKEMSKSSSHCANMWVHSHWTFGSECVWKDLINNHHIIICQRIRMPAGRPTGYDATDSCDSLARPGPFHKFWSMHAFCGSTIFLQFPPQIEVRPEWWWHRTCFISVFCVICGRQASHSGLKRTTTTENRNNPLNPKVCVWQILCFLFGFFLGIDEKLNLIPLTPFGNQEKGYLEICFFFCVSPALLWGLSFHRPTIPSIFPEFINQGEKQP